MKIIILSRNEKLYSTGRLLVAAKERGHEAEVADYLKCSVVIEKGNPVVDYMGNKIVQEHIIAPDGRQLPGVDAIIPRIGTSKTFYGSAVVRQFEMMKVFTTAKSLAIVRSRDKLRSLQILAKAGIGMPTTVFASRPSDIKNLISMVGGPPVIIKVIEGTQGIGVVLAETAKAAKSVIEAFHGLKVNILIQEFIKEAKGADIRAFIVGGKIAAAMKRKGLPGEFRANIHLGGSAIPITLSQDEKETALGAAKALGLSIAGVDLLQSERGPLVLEVNSSPGLEGIEDVTEIDIADKIINYVEKHALKSVIQKDIVGV
jgi:ribosomal protein S6--L-glutamate ligase